MTFSLCLLTLCTGVVLAAEAASRPVARGVLEGLGGTLIVFGLGLLGAELPLYR